MEGHIVVRFIEEFVHTSKCLLQDLAEGFQQGIVELAKMQLFETGQQVDFKGTARGEGTEHDKIIGTGKDSYPGVEFRFDDGVKDGSAVLLVILSAMLQQV